MGPSLSGLIVSVEGALTQKPAMLVARTKYLPASEGDRFDRVRFVPVWPGMGSSPEPVLRNHWRLGTSRSKSGGNSARNVTFRQATALVAKGATVRTHGGGGTCPRYAERPNTV